MDAENERAIMVHWNRNLINFTGCYDGFYFFDTSAPENHCVSEDSTNNTTKKSIDNYSMITTISSIK